MASKDRMPAESLLRTVRGADVRQPCGDQAAGTAWGSARALGEAQESALRHLGCCWGQGDRGERGDGAQGAACPHILSPGLTLGPFTGCPESPSKTPTEGRRLPRGPGAPFS